MERFKEHFLNGTLVVLVASSVALSSRVWFPHATPSPPAAKEALVQTPPPALDRRMPDVFRPERIIVERKDGQVAILPIGPGPYSAMWRLTRELLLEVRPSTGPLTSLDDETVPAEVERVTLALPGILKMGEWADRWGWSTSGQLNLAVRVDRVVFHFGKSVMVSLGAAGATYWFGPVPDADAKRLQDAIKNLPPAAFTKRHAFDQKNLNVVILPGVAVPEVKEVPVAVARTRRPDVTAEEARFFPDLSVVRQIDERDATSLTDGQRLVRVTAVGALEYRTAESAGQPPDLARALATAQDWVGTHGGWPQELLFVHYLQLPGKTRLYFELRSTGPFPVESAGGGLQVDMAADRVTEFQRYPDLVETQFTQRKMAIISPEAALQYAAGETTLFLFESVRDIHLAYMLRQRLQPLEADWVLEPSWVVHVGDARVYVPAAQNLEKRQLTIIR